MNWKYFVAQRLLKENDLPNKYAQPAITIALWGTSIGIAVMILSVFIVLGFKNQVKNKVISLQSEIVVGSFSSYQGQDGDPIRNARILSEKFTQIPGVKRVQTYSQCAGLILTDDAFEGVMLKGISGEYNLDFISHNIVEGEIPCFEDSTASTKVLISQTLCKKLQLGVGDSFNTYFLNGEKIRARKFKVSGIYQTNFHEFDNKMLYTDIYTVNKLNKYSIDEVSGIEINTLSEYDYELVATRINQFLDQEENKDSRCFAQPITQIYPQIFAWLNLLDMNVWAILILMLGIGGFTMVSGLLIIILEKTNMIGVLKSLGATDNSIRRTFLYFASFIVLKGMFWGNLAAIVLYYIQQHYKVFKLDASIYYLDYVPMEFNLTLYLLLNITALVATIMMLIAPSMIISKINPAKTMQFD